MCRGPSVAGVQNYRIIKVRQDSRHLVSVPWLSWCNLCNNTALSPSLVLSTDGSTWVGFTLWLDLLSHSERQATASWLALIIFLSCVLISDIFCCVETKLNHFNNLVYKTVSNYINEFSLFSIWNTEKTKHV